MKRISNFPDWAESHFASLCDEAGTVRNKANHDRTGWDYVLELDREHCPDLPHDKQRGSVTARVQIKSKIGGRPRAELKLTNALRFCREDDPCFVVLYWKATSNDSVSIYAREFNGPLISAALRKAREADRDGIQHLNRVKVPILFTNADEHTSDLVPWIVRHTDVDSIEYALAKSEVNRSSGYEEFSAKGFMTFKQDDLRALLENSVGLRETAPISSVEFTDVRFDIASRTPIFSGAPESFSMTVQPQPATLTFLHASGRTARFYGEFRAATMPSADAEVTLASFINDNFKAVIELGKPLNIHYNFRNDTIMQIDELKEQLNFSNLGGLKISTTLTVEGREPLQTLPTRLPRSKDPYARWLTSVVDYLIVLCRLTDNPCFSLWSLIENDKDVQRFVEYGINSNLHLQTKNVPSRTDLSRVKCVLYYKYLEVSGWTFAAVIKRPVLSFSRTPPGDVEFVFGDPIILHQVVEQLPETQVIGGLRLAYKTLQQRLGYGTCTVHDGDIMKANGVGNVLVS